MAKGKDGLTRATLHHGGARRIVHLYLLERRTGMAKGKDGLTRATCAWLARIYVYIYIGLTLGCTP